MAVRKKLVLDESNKPIAVQIDYEDWLEIEKRLGERSASSRTVDLESLRGSIQLTEDPLEFQRRMRGEWD